MTNKKRAGGEEALTSPGDLGTGAGAQGGEIINLCSWNIIQQ